MESNSTDSHFTDHQVLWIAVQTFYCQEKKVSNYLDEHQVKHFIPTLTHVVNEDGKTIRSRKPAVHNLLFLQVNQCIEELKSIIADCPFPVSVYHRFNKPGEWIMIPDSDMSDLRIICDNTFTEPIFVSSQECELKVGSMVRVKCGPLKNMEGKLVRKNKKYYLVRTFGNLGVMVSVSRWCCEAKD